MLNATDRGAIVTVPWRGDPVDERDEPNFAFYMRYMGHDRHGGVIKADSSGRF